MCSRSARSAACALELGVGTFLAPDDFIALHTSISIYDDVRGHAVPSFTRRGGARSSTRGTATRRTSRRRGRRRLLAGERPAVRDARRDPLHRPSSPTSSGMTMASECIVARELGLSYAAVCIVDNLANGVARAAAHPGGVRSRQARQPGSRARRARRAWSRRSHERRAARPSRARSPARRRPRRAPRRRRHDHRARPRRRAPQPGDEVLDAHGDVLLPGARERPHPRGDDAVPRLRRRSAAHGVAGAEDLARRGAPHRRRRVLGHPARVRRDDPQRHGAVLGHVLATGRGRARACATRGCAPRSGRRSIDGMDPAREQGSVRRGGATRSTSSPSTRRWVQPCARAARHLHRERADARVGRRAVGRRAACPCTSTSSRPRTR